MKAINELHFSGNAIASLPKRIFKMKSLTVLALGNNRVPLLLSDSIGQLPNLERLYLRGTTLSNVPTTLTSLVPGLIDLDVNSDVTLPEITKPPLEDSDSQSDERREGTPEREKEEGGGGGGIESSPMKEPRSPVPAKKVTLTDSRHKDEEWLSDTTTSKKDKEDSTDNTPTTTSATTTKSRRESDVESVSSPALIRKDRKDRKRRGKEVSSESSEQEDDSDDPPVDRRKKFSSSLKEIPELQSDEEAVESEREKERRSRDKLEKHKHREEKKQQKRAKKQLKKEEKEKKREAKIVKKKELMRSPSASPKRKMLHMKLHHHHKVHDEVIIPEESWKDEALDSRRPPTTFPIHIPKVKTTTLHFIILSLSLSFSLSLFLSFSLAHNLHVILF